MGYYNGTNNSDVIHGSKWNDFIIGNNGNDVLYGEGGNDIFFRVNNWNFIEKYSGTLGADTMYGGSGNDKYLVDNAGDQVIEYAGEGNDTVYSTITYHLPANVENGYLIIAGLKDLYGNSLDNKLTGNCYANHIMGGDGNDTIMGGGYGKDTLEGGNGNDWIKASVSKCQLYGNAGDDKLVGWYNDDLLCGGSGNDIYQGFTKESSTDQYGNYFFGFGHDIIRDYTDNNQTISNNSATEHNAIDLSLFGLGQLSFKAKDMDHDRMIDALYISAGKYGSIQIDKYFDDASRSVALSHQGVGSIYDIQVAGNHLHFDDIVNLLS